jgi:hypothetical protein
VNFKSVVAVNRYQLSTVCSNDGTTWQPDPQSGAPPINSNLADLHNDGKCETAQIDVHLLDYPDKETNELGARGSARSRSLVSPPPSPNLIGDRNRVRALPVKIEDLPVEALNY